MREPVEEEPLRLLDLPLVELLPDPPVVELLPDPPVVELEMADELPVAIGTGTRAVALPATPTAPGELATTALEAALRMPVAVAAAELNKAELGATTEGTRSV